MGTIAAGTIQTEETFEIFLSSGAWEALFGKPLLQTFRASYQYVNNTIALTLEGEDLDGIAEPSKAMEYKSDTLNDESIDSEENEEEMWEGEWPEEGEPSQVPDGEEISEPDKKDKNLMYQCL